MKFNTLKFVLYLMRWQLSTPILWIVVRNLGTGIGSTILANLIGASIFFWVDQFIFTSKAVELWQFKEKGRCDGCGKETGLWRLALAPGYDRRSDENPKFLCMECSKRKTEELRARGLRLRGRSK